MYGSIEGWQEYVASRGITGQTIDETSLPALVRASDYVKYHYVVNFRSPYGEDVPEVELATYEIACIENTTPGFFSTTFIPSEAVTLVNVDSIRWERTYKKDEAPDHSSLVPISTKADNYLRPYMRMKSNAGIFSVGPRQ